MRLYRVSAGVKKKYLEASRKEGEVKGTTLIMEHMTQARVQAFLENWGLESFRWINIGEE